MKLCFDSIDEVKAFVTQLKTTRGGKAKDDSADEGAALGQIAGANANASAQGGVGGLPAGNAGFVNPSPGAGQVTGSGAAGAFPGTGQQVQQQQQQQQQPQTVQMHPLAKAIIERADASIAQGHPVDGVTTWFRNLLGAEAAQMNWEQIKSVAVPRLNETQLKQIAPQLGIAV